MGGMNGRSFVETNAGFFVNNTWLQFQPGVYYIISTSGFYYFIYYFCIAIFIIKSDTDGAELAANFMLLILLQFYCNLCCYC